MVAPLSRPTLAADHHAAIQSLMAMETAAHTMMLEAAALDLSQPADLKIARTMSILLRNNADLFDTALLGELHRIQQAAQRETEDGR